MTTCGGCRGQGSHRRGCPALVGDRASEAYRLADRLSDVGDRLGPTRHTNEVWAIANELRVLAVHLTADFKKGTRDADRQLVDTDQEGTES